MRKHGRNVEPVPGVFSWPPHPDDKHLFNLAICSNARYLMVCETSLLKLDAQVIPAANEFRWLARELKMITPDEVADRLGFRAALEFIVPFTENHEH